MNRTGLKHEIKPTTVEVECVLKTKAIIGEGPVWSVKEQRLYWVDIPEKKIHVFDPESGSNKTFELPDMVTSATPRKTGGLILTLRKSVAYFDPATQKLDVLPDPEQDKPGNRFNDGKCDRQGRLWAGTMGDVDWDAPVGSLYRFDPGGKLSRMEEGVCCSNGLGWSPDSKTLYFAESFRYQIHAYDFDPATGAIANRRLFASVGDAKCGAFPDGLTVDAEGFVWSAQPVFGRLVRYDPKGAIERIIELPVSRGTSCMFGGKDLDVLYIPTMRGTLSDAQLAEEPLAGSLLALRPGVKGIAEAPFAG
jgi:sugar lactone lactonase YvrE